MREELGFSCDSVIISLVSRVHYSKGQLEFIRAAKTYLKKFKNIFLLLAGDIDSQDYRSKIYKNKIIESIEKNCLNNVIFLGFQKDVS